MTTVKSSQCWGDYPSDSYSDSDSDSDSKYESDCRSKSTKSGKLKVLHLGHSSVGGCDTCKMVSKHCTCKHTYEPPSRVCRHWAKGCCRMGPDCKFEHEHKTHCGGRCGGTHYCRSKPCKYWHFRLKCPFGDTCTYAHVPPCKDFMRGDCDGTECSEGSHPEFVKNKYLCWHWAKYGKCKQHEKGTCGFGHSSKHQNECKHHKAGRCYHGNQCRYFHS